MMCDRETGLFLEQVSYFANSTVKIGRYVADREVWTLEQLKVAWRKNLEYLPAMQDNNDIQTLLEQVSYWAHDPKRGNRRFASDFPMPLDEFKRVLCVKLATIYRNDPKRVALYTARGKRILEARAERLDKRKLRE